MASNNILPSVHYQCESNTLSINSSPSNASANLRSEVGAPTNNNIPPSSRKHRSFSSFNFPRIHRLQIEEDEDDFGQICRICHGDDSKEKFVCPCNCRGSLGAVHRSCIELYLNSRINRKNKCDICKAKIPVKLKRGSVFKFFSEDRKRLTYIMSCIYIMAAYILFVSYTVITLKALGFNDIFFNFFKTTTSQINQPHLIKETRFNGTSSHVELHNVVNENDDSSNRNINENGNATGRFSFYDIGSSSLLFFAFSVIFVVLTLYMNSLLRKFDKEFKDWKKKSVTLKLRL